MKVAVSHKWLHQLLDLSPNAAFVATLAASAAESGMLDLGNWLLAFFGGPSSSTMKVYLSKQLLKFVEDKLQQEADRSQNGGREPVFPEKVVDDIFRIISEAAEQLPSPVHVQVCRRCRRCKGCRSCYPCTHEATVPARKPSNPVGVGVGVLFHHPAATAE